MNDSERIAALEAKIEKIEGKINLIKIGVDKLVAIQCQKAANLKKMSENLPSLPLMKG